MKIELSECEPVNPLVGASWVDSHLHFDAFDEAGLAATIIERARLAGVTRLVAIGGSDEANERALKFARQHPDEVSAVIGYDRDKAGEEVDIASLHAMLKEYPEHIGGIGESGLDYHYEPDTAPQQKKLFASMLEVAVEVERPIVVHSREADADTLDMLRSFTRDWKGDPAYPGVLHCFTGSYDFARKLLDLGMLISFSGILTFRNADDLRACAAKLPLDRILIETDAPYLAPVPYRGKSNEPAWTPRVAETLASVRADTLQTIAEITTANAVKLFRLKRETA
jgi:TatD DNase family protein